MAWQDRSYSSQDEYGAEQRSGGMRSWFGGLPAPGRAVKYIAIANVAMFLLCQLTGGQESPVYGWLAMYTPAVLHGQVWRILTCTYLHDQTGVGHILMNMLGLYFLGMPLEQHWGTKRFFVFYTVGSFAAVLAYFLLTLVGWLSPHAILIGASGGVLAVLGACAVLFPQIRIILIFFPVPIRPAALLFVILYVFNVVNRGSNAGGDACHIAGLAVGIAWAYLGPARIERFWHNWRAESRQRALQAEHEQVRNLEGEVDRILEKVSREGIASLSRREKTLLQEATRRRQELERRQ